MDFYLATPTGDVHLFSSEDGRTVQLPVDHIADVGEMVPSLFYDTEGAATDR